MCYRIRLAVCPKLSGFRGRFLEKPLNAEYCKNVRKNSAQSTKSISVKEPTRAVRSLTLCRLKVYILKNYYMELTLELIERVKECLEYIRPQLQADGGDVEFVELQDGGKVFVKLTGACGS